MYKKHLTIEVTSFKISNVNKSWKEEAPASHWIEQVLSVKSQYDVINIL